MGESLEEQRMEQQERYQRLQLELEEQRLQQQERYRRLQQDLEEQRLQQQRELRLQQERGRLADLQHAEQLRLAGEQERRLVQYFLKVHGYKSATTPKKSLSWRPFKTSYAIHKAAMEGDSWMVKMLIAEGADPDCKNSSGRTPMQVAQALNTGRSHDDVVEVLRRALFGS